MSRIIRKDKECSMSINELAKSTKVVIAATDLYNLIHVGNAAEAQVNQVKIELQAEIAKLNNIIENQNAQIENLKKAKKKWLTFSEIL